MGYLDSTGLAYLWGKIKAKAEVFYVDLEGSYPNYTCPVAMADIKAAYEAGKELKCRCAMGTYTATLPLFIPVPEVGQWTFSGSGELADMDFPAQTFTVAVTGFGVQASNTKLATTKDKLPNPYTLTITSGSNSVTYDGHAEKGIDIPAGPSGAAGKSAYAAAQDGGYTGTETAFNAALAQVENKAAKATAKSVTLTASGWGSNYQTVAVPGVTSSSNIIVTAAPASYIAYAEAGVRCTGQGSGALSFACEETPTQALTVNVLILG